MIVRTSLLYYSGQSIKTNLGLILLKREGPFFGTIIKDDYCYSHGDKMMPKSLQNIWPYKYYNTNLRDINFIVEEMKMFASCIIRAVLNLNSVN